MKLTQLKTGRRAAVSALNAEGALLLRLLELGLTPKAVLTLERCAPLGDPMQIKVRRSRVSLRRCDAELIEIEPVGRDK